MNEEINVQAAIPEAIGEEESPKEVSDDEIPDADLTNAPSEPLCDPLETDPNPDPDAPSTGTSRDEVLRLEEELRQLKEEIRARDERDERLQRDYAEFATLYPDVSPHSLPDSVLADVNRGIPLAAAYALEERRRVLLNQKAETTNAENKHLSTGAVNGTPNLYYSPAEVRAMSHAEVKKNYHLILESMKSWN